MICEVAGDENLLIGTDCFVGDLAADQTDYRFLLDLGLECDSITELLFGGWGISELQVESIENISKTEHGLRSDYLSHFPMVSIRTANLKATLLLNNNIGHQISIMKKFEVIKYQSHSGYTPLSFDLQTHEITISYFGDICFG